MYSSYRLSQFIAFFIDQETKLSRVLFLKILFYWIIDFEELSLICINDNLITFKKSSCFSLIGLLLMILPQVHLRKPCYDFSFLQIKRFKSISPTNAKVLEFHLHIQSVGATGGVYKGQGRIHLELVTRYYKEFLVQNK